MTEHLMDTFKDKYTPSEFVEQLGIGMDDLLFYLRDYFEDTSNLMDNFNEDMEQYYGKE